MTTTTTVVTLSLQNVCLEDEEGNQIDGVSVIFDGKESFLTLSAMSALSDLLELEFTEEEAQAIMTGHTLDVQVSMILFINYASDILRETRV